MIISPIEDIKTPSPSSLGTAQISSQDLSLLMNDHETRKKLIIIDARFPYEYEGGHIAGALNVWSFELLVKLFLMDSADCQELRDRGLSLKIVFHCEFSSKRAPALIMQLRKLDRINHAESYPALFFPNLYLLQGGFCSVFESHLELCVRNCIYRPMICPAYAREMWACERLRKCCKTSSAMGCAPSTTVVKVTTKVTSPGLWDNIGNNSSRRLFDFSPDGYDPTQLSLESMPTPRVKRKSIESHTLQLNQSWHSKSLLDDIADLV